jgi:hypothetical protein
MKAKLEQLKKDFLEQLKNINSEEELKVLENSFLGKK